MIQRAEDSLLHGLYQTLRKKKEFLIITVTPLHSFRCDENKATQRWTIENVNLDQLAKWDDPMKDLF